MPEVTRIHIDMRQYGMDELWEAQMQQRTAFKLMRRYVPGSDPWIYWSQVQREAGWRILYEQSMRK